MALAGAITGASSAAGQLPTSCTPILTVQKHACALENFYRCDGSEGIGVFIANFNKEGQKMSEAYTQDFEFVWVLHPVDEAGMVAIPDKGPAFSLKRLLETGRETVSRFLVLQMPYLPQKEIPFSVDVTLTGETTVIDGTELLVGRQVGVITIGAPFGSYHVEGEVLISPRDNLLIEGQYTIRAGDKATPKDNDQRIVRLIREGEAGFMATEPQYDCGGMLSQLKLTDARGRG